MAKQKTNIVGDGIVTYLDGQTLHMEVDLSKNFGESGSGKTIRVASSKGGVQVPDAPDIQMNVNIYKYKPRS